MNRENLVLVVVDVQDGLLNAMDRRKVRSLIRNIKILITFAKEMRIPILLTEQYPRGLGNTTPEIKRELEPILPIEKVAFSCCEVEVFNKKLDSTKRKQIILSGIETHICILQTGIDLLKKGFDVEVLADATCSRKEIDWEIGLKYLDRKGAVISTTEIIAFQLLKEAGTEEFRRLSKLFK
jgi:isochorismate hydrolase